MINEKDSTEKGSIEIMLGDSIVLQKRNRIVATSRTIKASMSIGGPSADYIRFISLGRTNATPPPVVLDSDTGLFNPVIDVNVSFQSEPSPFITSDPSISANSTIVTWTAVVPIQTEITFDEAGLFSNQSYMFSRVTFPAIVKPIGIAMAIRWKIEF